MIHLRAVTLACLLSGAIRFPLPVAAQSGAAVAPAPARPRSLRSAADQFFQAGDMTIRFREVGAGEPVILVHGWSGNLADWNSVADTLAATHRVIAIDVRGFGKSSKSGDPAKFGSQMADDVIRLMDHLGIARAHLAGHSMGALIVANTASRYSQRVSTVTLVSGPFFITDSPAQASTLADLRAGRGMAHSLRLGFPSLDSAVVDAIAAQILAENDVPSMIASASSVGALDITGGGAPNVPALVMCGTADPTMVLSRRIATWWPGARLIEVPDATHEILRRPEIGTAMRAFMK